MRHLDQTRCRNAAPCNRGVPRRECSHPKASLAALGPLVSCSQFLCRILPGGLANAPRQPPPSRNVNFQLSIPVYSKVAGTRKNLAHTSPYQSLGWRLRCSCHSRMSWQIPATALSLMHSKLRSMVHSSASRRLQVSRHGAQMQPREVPMACRCCLRGLSISTPSINVARRCSVHRRGLLSPPAGQEHDLLWAVWAWR